VTLSDDDGLISVVRRRACVVTMRRLNRYEVIEIWRHSGVENLVSERDNLIFIHLFAQQVTHV